MIDEDILACYMQAGEIAKKCRDHAAGMVKPGQKIVELVDTVEQEILDEGGLIAFPLNISRNADAAHDTAGPGDEREFMAGDVVKVDMGVHIDGYVADTAVTVDLGENNLLVEASAAALKRAISLVRPGVSTGELGAAIHDEITGRGYLPIANLTGHGLGQYRLHGSPTIPNIGIKGGTIIEEDMVFAIEPFASTGSGHVSNSQRTEIFGQIALKPVRLASAKKVIAEVRDRHSLPFARRWLTGNKIDIALSSLRKSGVIHGYPVLHDIPGSLVSQAEHTVIVTADGCIVTTR
ncbi:MAG: type II methionyl aminopeptidase [Deltaproteobacteria bacterium]|nr:type II methionyl aminopeptidase [Deltaproteobacteria bacterium]